MARTTFRFDGGKELEKALKELPDNVGRGVARRAVKKAGEEMADEQRRRVPVDDGELRDSIRVKVSTRNLDGLAEYAAVRQSGGSSGTASAALRSARREAKATGNHKGHRIAADVGPTKPHAHLVEFGTGPRNWKKNGKSTGIMPASPYIRPAFDNGVGQAVDTITDGLTEEVAKAAKRMSKRLAKKGRN